MNTKIEENKSVEVFTETEVENTIETDILGNFQESIEGFGVHTKKSFDDGLILYREQNYRPIVEWFYTQITGDVEIAKAILHAADFYNVPISLAFSLAFVESSFNPRAVNRNSNETIDRGLFQLNSNTFPSVSEKDFFVPSVSAEKGLSHLRFCLDTAGNTVSALAMYNAGTTRVRSNKTPQTTLNYVGKIMAYQKTLDELFSEQVVTFFNEQQQTSDIFVAYAR